MNQKYSEILFEHIPVEERKVILRTKVKGNIPGFRRPDLAPAGVLKGLLRSEEKFCGLFLRAVASTYGCAINKYSDEEQLPELTLHNFFGVFAWKCYRLDGSPESCNKLDEILQKYTQMLSGSMLSSEESQDQESGNFQDPVFVPEDEKQEETNIYVDGSKKETDLYINDVEENFMFVDKQYIGYVQETNGYYNFWPVCCIIHDEVEPLSDDEILSSFPDLGNINLSSTPWDYVGRKCSNGEILVITFSSSDLIDNRRQDGFFQRTNYKVDFNFFERQGRIKRLADIQIYPVLHPVGQIDFSKKTVLAKEKYVYTKDKCLIKEGDILYGPYQVNLDEDEQTEVNLTSDYVVESHRAKNGEIDYIDLGVPGYSNVSVVRLDDRFLDEPIDKITDQGLFKLFERSLAGRKDGGKYQITPVQVDDYATMAFHGLSDEIIQNRVQRIKGFLEEQFKQEEVQEEVAHFVSDLFYKFGESDYFSNLLERILDNSDLAKKIQSFAIVKQRLSDMQQRYEEIRRQCDEEREKLDAEAKDREVQISVLAESTSEEIRSLTAQKEELLQVVSEIKNQKKGLETVDELEREKVRLKAINDDLHEEEQNLRNRVDNAIQHLQKKLKQSTSTSNTIDIAFDGRIADQIFQAAAEWNRHNQEDKVKRIAEQLINTAGANMLSEEELVEYLLKSVKRYRPDYNRNEVLNIFINISQNFLTVFSGDPGTGKTSICNIIAHILGTSQINSLIQIEEDEKVEISRYVSISVERGWTSKRDFIGYYNPLSQEFEKANKHLYDGLRILNAEKQESQYPFIVLLDEANLSPIEYYWADFMNICDSNSSSNMITLGNDIQMHIPQTLRFVATINNDDTTERLSPRLLDRAAMIRLPNVEYRKIDDEDLKDNSFVKIIPWNVLYKTFTNNDEDEMDETPKRIYGEICNQLRKLRICLSPRVDRAICRYWVAAKRWFESDDVDQTIIALDYAVAQRLLPKINGSGMSYKNHLTGLYEICEKNNLIKCSEILKDIMDRGQDAMNYYQYF